MSICPKLQQYKYIKPKPLTTSDLPTPIGIIAISIRHKIANTDLSMLINNIYTSPRERGKGTARALIAYAINNHPSCKEIHTINRAYAPQQERARNLFNDLSLHTTTDTENRIINTDGSDIHVTTLTTPLDIDNDEYRFTPRDKIKDAMSMRFWQDPIITKHDFSTDTLSADIINLIQEIDNHNNNKIGDKSDIYKILQEADYIYIAYTDPLLPRGHEINTDPQIHTSLEPSTDMDTSTPTTTRKLLHKLSSHKDYFQRGRSRIGDPSILHRVHSMTRSELEYNIQYADSCLKRISSTHTPGYLLKPSRRRLITSRLSQRAAESYNNMIYRSDTSIR